MKARTRRVPAAAARPGWAGSGVPRRRLRGHRPVGAVCRVGLEAGGGEGPDAPLRPGAGAPGGIGPMRGGLPPRGAGELKVFVLKHAKAQELLPVVERLFRTAEFTAEVRTNQLIARGDAETLMELAALLEGSTWTYRDGESNSSIARHAAPIRGPPSLLRSPFRLTAATIGACRTAPRLKSSPRWPGTTPSCRSIAS